jgi:hypothetical protein
MQPVDDRERAIKARARRQRATQVQRRRLVLLAVVVIVIVVIVALAVRSCGDEGTAGSTTTETTGTGSTSSAFSADLTGADSVPAVETQAAAVLTLDYDSAAKEMAFKLEVTSQISVPSAATICQGLPGEYGTVVYTLFAGPAKDGNFRGVLAEGTIVQDELIGPLEGGTVADLVALIGEGDAYVSIGNDSHPVDAIRGPIK